GIGERSVCVLNPHMNGLADIFQADVSHQRAGQQAGFAQDLKAIADAEYESASIGEFLDRLHNRGELSDRTGAQVIAVGETAGHQNGVAVLQIVRLVPEKGYRLLGNLLDGPVRIVIVVRSGKDDDAEFHRWSLNGRDPFKFNTQNWPSG